MDKVFLTGLVDTSSTDWLVIFINDLDWDSVPTWHVYSLGSSVAMTFLAISSMTLGFSMR